MYAEEDIIIVQVLNYIHLLLVTFHRCKTSLDLKCCEISLIQLSLVATTPSRERL